MATPYSGSIDLYLKTYTTAQGDNFLRGDNVVFYHPLDDFEEATQDQVWQGSSSFVAGKIGNAGTSAAAVSAFEFTPNASGFTQVMPAEPVFCLLGSGLLVYHDYFGRVGSISGTDITWGDLQTHYGNVNHQGIFPLSWDSGAETGYVWTWGSSPGTTVRQAIHLSQVDGNALTMTKKDSHNCTVTNGTIYMDARFAVLDMSGTTKPTGSILIGEQDNACIFSVSGDVFSSGVSQTISNGVALHNLISIDDTHAVSLSADGKVRVLTIDVGADTITEGSGYTACDSVKSANPSDESWQSKLIHVDGNKFAVIYLTTGYACKARLGEIDGSGIILGNQVEVSLGNDIDPDWTTTFIRPSLLDNETIYIDYNHYESVANIRQAKYRIAQVNGMDLSLSNESIRYTHPDVYVGYNPVLAISASSIVAMQRYRTASDRIKYWAFGEPQYGFNLTAPNESAYPNTSGSNHIAWGMWTKNLTTDETVFETERDYQLTITPSSIALGSGTATWNDAAISGLLAVNNDGSNHFLALDFEYSGSNDWYLRTSMDGSGWTDQGVQNSGSLSPVSIESDPSVAMSNATHTEWVDELIMWGGTFDRFTDDELINLYNLGDGGYTMGQYGDIYQDIVSASGDLFIQSYGFSTKSGDLFISGPQQIIGSGSLFMSAPEQVLSSGDLFIHGYDEIGTSGDMFVHGHVIDTASGNLFIYGHILLSSSSDLFMHGHDNIATSGDLFIIGYIDTTVPIRIIHRLTRAADYDPQLIGSFSGGMSTVNIRVWDIIDGLNTPVTLANSGCYQIGDTNKWGWSTEHLSFIPSHHNYHYYFAMSGNNGETDYGEFFLTVPERGRWSHP